MKKIIRIFAKKSLSFHIWGIQHTIRIYALYEAPVGEPAKEYKFFVLSSCDAFCPRKSPPTKNSSKEKRSQGNKKFKCFKYLKKQTKRTSPEVSYSDKSTNFFQFVLLIP